MFCFERIIVWIFNTLNKLEYKLEVDCAFMFVKAHNKMIKIIISGKPKRKYKTVSVFLVSIKNIFVEF